jgi:hypothetical protein
LTIVLLAALCLVAVGLQDVLPGNAWYHSASYALLLSALCALLLWRLQKRAGTHELAFRPLAIVTAAAVVIAATGLAAGLLGPDTQTYMSAPGAGVALSEPRGRLQFPFDPSPAQGSVVARFEDDRGRVLTLPENVRRYTGGFVMWSSPHQAAVVSAEDLLGRRLTITQPSNPSFLSPVLLFAQSARIGGRTLPVDTFSIPAAQRTVKAVLFSAAALTQMRGHSQTRPAVLAAVEDRRGRLLPGAIRLIPSGGQAVIGGVIIGATVADYPQIVVAAAPFWPVFVLGIAAFGAGCVWLALLKNPFRS